jgi:formylglycine-generating enzyme required for sulfatase activity
MMVLIPAGEFQMGESPENMARLIGQSEPFRSQETPRHAVVLTQHYYMDVHELTVARWESFLTSTAYKAKGRPVPRVSPDEPARGLAHEDAVAYANWVGCALPTEAQWERAARGGEAGLFYPWGASDDISKRNGAELDDGFEDVAPVGSFPPNPYGLFDMSGNVEEWCRDWYDTRYYSHSPLTDPTGPARSWGRVVRGGNYWAGSSGLTVSCRGGNRDVIDFTGCRLCRAVVD